MNIPYELILNYDQTWVNAWRNPKTMLKKKRTNRPSQNQTRIVHITGGRAGISVCISSWCNGDVGPLFVSVGSGNLSDAWVKAMNKMLARWCPPTLHMIIIPSTSSKYQQYKP